MADRISVECPGCLAKVTLPDSSKLGKKVKCPKCSDVFVAEAAQKTQSLQANHNLLLADSAEVNTKPELEIYADDVQCAHGATVGELSEQSIFYLRSRGLDEKTARSLLIAAFLEEVLDHVPHEAARDALKQHVEGWFGGRT